MTQVYTFDDVELLQLVNHNYTHVVDALRREGFLTPEQAQTLHTEYSVIVETTSWMPKALSKWLGLKDGRLGVRLARVIAREKADD